MQKPTNLPDCVSRAEPIAAKLQAIRDGIVPVVFEHVTEPARPFVAGLIARAVARRIWIVCENVRAQELFHNELLNWQPDALFFPEMELAAAFGAQPDPEIAAERLEILEKMRNSEWGTRNGKTKRAKRVEKVPHSPFRVPSSIIVLTRASLDDDVPAPGALEQIGVKLARGARMEPEKLVAQLDVAGYDRVPQVSERGQFAVRGGIVDVFSWQQTLPVRVEFLGDEIESLRQFDPDAQTSVQHLDACTLLLGDAGAATCAMRDYIGDDDLVIDASSPEGMSFPTAQIPSGEDGAVRKDAPSGETIGAHVTLLDGAAGADAPEDFSAAFFDHGLGEFDAGDLVIGEAARERFFTQLRDWCGDGWRVFIFCNNEGEIERLREMLPPEIVANEHVALTTGTLTQGFTFPAAKVAVLSDAELFGRYRNTRSRRLTMRRAREQVQRSQIDFSELNEGELVVHLEHGIGKYRGVQNLPGSENAGEVLVLEFSGESKLYVPLEQSYLVSRYVGVGKRTPPLSDLGDAKWARAKKTAEGAVFDYAAKLLSIHAERETRKGFAFAPDGKWQREFEQSFLFKETPDQITAIADTKADMENEKPMDRLICGDVGFGKTEVAIRAAFKAVMAGRQVALLCPTTVLAQQHWNTLRERMSDYPVVVEMLSRFRTQAEQRRTLKGLADGSVDIVVGTHRLISGDVQFKNLGLVVIDEEQRFGVLHKEKFKDLFQLVDVLTLSATPIPRTLYLSLVGAKDMSTIETPPANRIPVETLICPYDERIIRDAIQRELSRQGQVYFLHNRIHSIEKIAGRIRELVPGARVEIGHGQMDEHELEAIMQRFVAGETDVLVSTTIIESGLDIPNANTIVIDRADRFGLADLYQLRGRVGRAQHKAYAYLMLPRDMMSAGEARKRINAIKQYSSLGAGFKIAMRDLEIRGAGNILGTAQSGHIFSIGFDLYCQLLKQAVAKLKGEKVRPRIEVLLRLDCMITSEPEWVQRNIEHRTTAGSPLRSSMLNVGCSMFTPAFLPTSYIADAPTRIRAYRGLAEIASQEHIDALRKTWRDRFGPLPDAAENLLTMAAIKLVAASRKISRVEVREEKLMLTRGGDYVLIGGKFPRLAATSPDGKLREMLAMIRSF